MASVLLRLGILFTIAVTNLPAQGVTDIGTEDGKKSVEKDLSPGVKLVPGPHRVVVRKKESLLLNCSLDVIDSEIKILKYIWQKDGKQIDSTFYPKTELFKNGSLQIYPRRKKVEGINSIGLYECIVTLSTGSLIARRVDVDVVSIGSTFTHEPSDQTVYEGGVARFECHINADPSPPFYIWFKIDEVPGQADDNLSQLSNGDVRISILDSGILQILDVKASDAGKYKCQAVPNLYFDDIEGKLTSGSIGGRVSRTAELKVLPGGKKRSPAIMAGPKNTVVQAGDPTVLECLADGWPRPKVTWKKKASDKGEEQTHEPANKDTNLHIPSVAPDYAGTYECIVSGEGVDLRSSATLNVTTPPKMISPPKSGLYLMAKNPKISCEANGNPHVTVSWYFNGKLLTDSDVGFTMTNVPQTLSMNALHTSSSGYYQCIANNSVGQQLGLAYIKIIQREGAPLAPKNVKIKEINSSTALVTWDHMPSGRPSVIHLGVVGKEYQAMLCSNIVRHSRQQCRLRDLKPETEYYINVQAFSSKSASERSEIVHFTTKKEAISPVAKKTVPEFIINSVQDFPSVNVSWQTLHDAQGRARRIPFIIYYRTKGGNDEASIRIPATQTSSVISGLESGTSYEVVVLPDSVKGHRLERSEWPWKTFHTVKAKKSNIFTVKFVNSTTVMLTWDPPMPSTNDDATISYSIELQHFGSGAFSEINISLTDHHLLTDLDEDVTYKVTLKTRSNKGVTRTSSQSFKILDLSPLVPDKIWAEVVRPHSMLLKWSAVPYQDVDYEVCYGKEFASVPQTCHLSSTPSYNVTDLQPYSHYELRVRALHGSTKRHFSNNIIVLTEQTAPSAPVNLTVEILKKGAVSLNWLPPEHPNGVITSYIIRYGKDLKNPSGQIAWKKITVPGTTTSETIGDLDKVSYCYKVAAATKVGPGPDSNVEDIIPDCPTKCPSPIRPTDDDNEPVVEDERKTGMPPTELAGIIVGVLLGIVLILVLPFLWCRRRCAKNRADDPNTSHSPICPANGHIPSIFNHSRPGNGHAQLVSNSTQPESTTPMLQQIPENERSDSKGGNNSIVTLNGVELNGYVRPNYWNSNRYSGELNHSHNSEEMQGLIKAMMASTDGRDVISGSGDTAIMMTSLEDVDHADLNRKTGDHSSEDSGTGCHRLGPNGRCNGLDSPASSPSGSSDANSSLGRRHLSLEGGHWGDEMGGLVMDPASGTVIGMTYGDDVLKEEDEEGEDWLLNSREGKASDEHASNDHDSGHGSEIKSHSMCANSSEPEHPPSWSSGCSSGPGSGASADTNPQTADSPNNPLTCRVSDATDLPPPPPSPPFSSQQLSSSSSSSSRNKHSNKVPQTDRPSHRHPRTNRLHTPISKLPPPPPPPPLSALSLTTPFQSLPEAATGSNKEGRPNAGKEEREGQKASSGSNASRQLSQEADVVFSQTPASSHPHNV